MKSSITWVTLFLVIIAVVYFVGAKEVCPVDNCMSNDKCEEPVRGNIMCANQADICCSIVISEFRTHCRHHGGECMKGCAPTAQRDVVDCSADQVCCVLV